MDEVEEKGVIVVEVVVVFSVQVVLSGSLTGNNCSDSHDDNDNVFICCFNS